YLVLVSIWNQYQTQSTSHMDSQTQNTSLQRLQNVEKRIVRVLELAAGVMDELSNPTGPRKEFVNNHCREFMQMIKDIQVALREEIKSACDYRPFEKCDYSSRIANEICCKKLDYVVLQLDQMKQTIDDYRSSTPFLLPEWANDYLYDKKHERNVKWGTPKERANTIPMLPRIWRTKPLVLAPLVEMRINRFVGAEWWPLPLSVNAMAS
ncbi:hypothetical protein F8388_014903, partial [Cannabis sativa]